MKELLQIARKSIASHLAGKDFQLSSELKSKFSDKKACFVTLTKNGALRGCIGSIQPRQELYKDVIENAENAAFNDPRFHPLQKNELSEIKIEISVLTIPKKIEFKDSNDIIKKLTKKEGVIIKKGWQSATYLPQVWEQIHDKNDFLSSLCIKAGLSSSAWKEKGIEVYFYYVEAVEE